MVLWKSRSSKLHWMQPWLQNPGEIPEGAVVNYAGDDDAAVPKKVQEGIRS